MNKEILAAHKNRLAEIKSSLKLLNTKIAVYAERDQLAMEVHQTKYMQLDSECLDLMTRIQEMESNTPPDHNNLT